jgi:hypothetical protein
MKRSPRSCKTPADLSDSMCKNLNMYAIAASAAGVGLLALAQPSEAKIVYTPTWLAISPRSTVNLDLNNDGVADFQLLNQNVISSNSSNPRFLSTLKASPQNPSNAIWGTGSFASVLGSGVSVGSQGKFQSGHQLMAGANGGCSENGSCRYGSIGQWKQITRGFLGLKFTIQGEIHYGWARLNITVTNRGVYAAVTGYAYESVPNTPIITGKEKGSTKKNKTRAGTASLDTSRSDPASLGLLARGALGLDVWRKRNATSS